MVWAFGLIGGRDEWPSQAEGYATIISLSLRAGWCFLEPQTLKLGSKMTFEAEAFKFVNKLKTACLKKYLTH